MFIASFMEGSLVQRLVIGDLRVQSLTRKDGLRSHTIVWPEGSVHREADRFLRTLEPGTDRTYAYLLVDHLRWLECEGLALETVSLRDLQRYMGAVGAKVAGPLGGPWREGKRCYGPSTLSTAAACIKGFYLHQSSLGVNEKLGTQLLGHGCPARPTGRGRCWGTSRGRCQPTRWLLLGCGAGIPRWHPRTPRTDCWRS